MIKNITLGLLIWFSSLAVAQASTQIKITTVPRNPILVPYGYTEWANRIVEAPYFSLNTIRLEVSTLR